MSITLPTRLASNPSFIEDVVAGLKVRELFKRYGDGCKETTIKEARRRVLFLQALEAADQDDPATEGAETPAEEARKPLTALQQHRQALVASNLIPPVESPLISSRERELERENELLRQQLTWSNHANPESHQGGTVTINHSDDHFGDRAHMLDCWSALWGKTLALLDIYKPDRIVMLSNGDKIAGRGVYKEQHMDSVLPMTSQQIDLAAYKVIRCDRDLKEKFPTAQVVWYFTHGNHDVNMGERLTPNLVYRVRAFGVDARYCGDTAILNLADQGSYYALFEHGTGHSNISPSSPKWVDQMKDKLLRFGRTYYAERRIRRVGHGHTHWASHSIERILDIQFDTTGGCQRNERVCLGQNSRPLGWIAYVSPRGYDDILDPILIQPSVEMVERELADPFLFNRNLEDASAGIREFAKMESDAGIAESNGLIPEGR